MAVYTDGSIDPSIVEDPPYNDMLVIHSLSLQPKYRIKQLETHIIGKIAGTSRNCTRVRFFHGPTTADCWAWRSCGEQDH